MTIATCKIKEPKQVYTLEVRDGDDNVVETTTATNRYTPRGYHLLFENFIAFSAADMIYRCRYETATNENDDDDTAAIFRYLIVHEDTKPTTGDVTPGSGQSAITANTIYNRYRIENIGGRNIIISTQRYVFGFGDIGFDINSVMTSNSNSTGNKAVTVLNLDTPLTVGLDRQLYVTVERQWDISDYYNVVLDNGTPSILLKPIADLPELASAPVAGTTARIKFNQFFLNDISSIEHTLVMSNTVGLIYYTIVMYDNGSVSNFHYNNQVFSEDITLLYPASAATDDNDYYEVNVDVNLFPSMGTLTDIKYLAFSKNTGLNAAALFIEFDDPISKTDQEFLTLNFDLRVEWSQQ